MKSILHCLQFKVFCISFSIFYKELKSGTLKAHVSAISVFTGISFSIDPLVIRFLRALNKLSSLSKGLVPCWDLNLVLNDSCDPPFEHLEQMDIKLLSMNVTFQSSQSGEYLSLVQIEEAYLLFLKDRVLLRTVPSFQPRNASNVNINKEIILPFLLPINRRGGFILRK